MQVYNSINHFPSNIKTAITIGTFDGVHIGHKCILKRLNKIAKKQSLQSVVLTFSSHPRHVLFPEDQSLKLLTTKDEKIKQIEDLGVQHLIIHNFTKKFSRIKSINFIRDILCNQLNMKSMVIGHDHHFGRNREGSFDELQDLSELYAFNLEIIQAQEINRIKVSSTKIRKALLLGEVNQANKLLGYNYTFYGRVIHGEKLGRTIGYPTANLKLDKLKLIPKVGVYAVCLNINSGRYFGMLNIGFDAVKTEVYVFNFSSDIYNKIIQIKIMERLRDNKNFDNLEQLKRQLKKDEVRCKKILRILE